ncbi:MAG: DsbA family protein [Armatimonadota bacterium]|nr:DsbA family protein [Armatimonadota bacterium]
MDDKDSSMTTRRITITVFSDYLCPWCWPAAVRLRKLVEVHPGQINLEHRAFLLRPDEKPTVFTAYHLQHRASAAARTGLPFHFPQIGDRYPRSSWPALEAAKWVRDHHPEAFDAFDLALFAAFFERTEDISSPAVLTAVVESVGVPGDGLTEALETRQYRDWVMADHALAQDFQINSIPTVTSGGYEVSGAVPYEEYENLLSTVRGAAQSRVA